MVLGEVKIFKNAINSEKLSSDAAKTVQLAKGEKWTVKDNVGFILLSVDNDTRKVKAKGNIERV